MIKRLIAAFSAIIACSILAYAATSLNQYLPGFRTIDGSQLNKMVDIVNRLQGVSATPMLSSCGTGPAITGSATAGKVTFGTGSPTGCIITFPTNYYSVAPYCNVTWAQSVSLYTYVVTVSALTLTQSATSSDIVNYNCLAQ